MKNDDILLIKDLLGIIEILQLERDEIISETQFRFHSWQNHIINAKKLIYNHIGKEGIC